MIQFANKPDAVFNEILNDIFETLITDCNAAAASSSDDVPYISEDILRLFGGVRTLSAILSKLKAAHDSPDVWEISPYYFLLLDDLLTTYTELYNDGIRLCAGDTLIHPDGRAIEELDIDIILDHFMLDRDYLLDPATATIFKSLPAEADNLRIHPEALNAARRLPPDTLDLWIRKSDYPWEEHELEEPDWFKECEIED